MISPLRLVIALFNSFGWCSLLNSNWTIMLSLTMLKYIRFFFFFFLRNTTFETYVPSTLIGIVLFSAGIRAVFLWLLFIIQRILFAFLLCWIPYSLDPIFFFFLGLLFLYYIIYNIYFYIFIYYFYYLYITYVTYIYMYIYINIFNKY